MRASGLGPAVKVGRTAGAGGGYQHHAEVRAHGKGAREEAQNYVGRGGGGYVIVFRLAGQQQVADTASGKIGLEAGCAQLRDDSKCGIELGRGGRHGCIYCRPFHSPPLQTRTLTRFRALVQLLIAVYAIILIVQLE